MDPLSTCTSNENKCEILAKEERNLHIWVYSEGIMSV